MESALLAGESCGLAVHGGNACDDWRDETVMKRVIEIARGPLAAAAQRIDGGHYPLDVMASLGAAGALGVHLDQHGGRFGLSLAAMQEASRACGATGFLMWAHDVCGLYIEQSGNPHLRDTLLDDHAHGRTFGGTALSNPMKAFSGIEPMMFRADQRHVALGQPHQTRAVLRRNCRRAARRRLGVARSDVSPEVR